MSLRRPVSMAFVAAATKLCSDFGIGHLTLIGPIGPSENAFDDTSPCPFLCVVVSPYYCCIVFYVLFSAYLFSLNYRHLLHVLLFPRIILRNDLQHTLEHTRENNKYLYNRIAFVLFSVVFFQQEHT
jgi:hypothetical protein